MGPDLTMSGTTGTTITNATLVPTGVTAETYGSNTQIPQIMVDAKGRITNASNISIFPARAWINFDGTTSPPTINASVNVSSVVKNSTGFYTVNFAVAMPDANYSIVTNCEAMGGYSYMARSPASLGGGTVNSSTYAYVSIEQGGLAPTDAHHISVAVFR